MDGASEPRLIPLRNKAAEVVAYALVEAEDYDWLSKFSWSLIGGRARRGEWHRGATRNVYMHRQILELEPGDQLEADHINRNPLDNRRANLRAVSHSENHHNRGAMPRSTSEHRGVSFDHARGNWRAQVTIGGRNHFVGRYASEQDAATAAAAFRTARLSHAIEDVAA